MLGIIQGIIALLNSIGAGVIANYISKNIGKWLMDQPVKSKHSKNSTPCEPTLAGGYLHVGNMI